MEIYIGIAIFATIVFIASIFMTPSDKKK